MKKNLPVTDKEISFEDELISTTDLKGAITGFNKAFEQVSGFSGEEMLHVNHNIIRHPDMPPAAFEDLWQSVKARKHWMGIVKNRSKSGDYYWVDAYVTPIFEGDDIVGYESVRAKPTTEQVERASQLYQQINKGQKPKLSNALQGLSIKNKSLVAAITSLSVTLLLNNWSLLSGSGALAQAALAFVGGAASFFVLRKWVFNSLDKALAEAQKEVNNPLMAMVYTGSADEVGQISLVNKLMQAKLRTILVRMKDSAEKIDQQALNMFKSQQAIMESTNSQASQTEQVATAMTEMSSSIQEVARNASEAAQHATDVDELTQTSVRLTSTAVSGLSSLDEAFEEISNNVAELEVDTNAINPIVDVISAIAEQTNLLALNAAIEAARAGEHGRGFAVVADEVRMLASRTQQSTTEISNLISKLNKTMAKAVQDMGQTKDTALNSRNEVEQSIASVTEIADKIRELNDLNTLIATAVEEQSSVSEDINRNIVQISSNADDVVTNASTVNQNAETLAGESATLSNMIKRFRMH